MSLETNTPIELSILKPGWVYGGDRISSSLIGSLFHLLFDRTGKSQPPRNLSSISVETLAIAAACQALDDGLPFQWYSFLMFSDIVKLYNHELQIYSDPEARKWLEEMAYRIVCI